MVVQNENVGSRRKEAQSVVVKLCVALPAALIGMPSDAHKGYEPCQSRLLLPLRSQVAIDLGDLMQHFAPEPFLVCVRGSGGCRDCRRSDLAGRSVIAVGLMWHRCCCKHDCLTTICRRPNDHIDERFEDQIRDSEGEV